MKNVLLVDDDSTSNFIHKKILQLTGAVSSIDVAHNGKEALLMLDSYVANHKLLDLILLDLNMPVLDGFGFLQWYNRLLLSDTIGAKIIVLSSSNNAADLARVKSLGAYAYWTKPLQSEQIVHLFNS